MKRHCLEPNGAAVVIVLAFIVIITILIVGLASSMRVDRPAANSHLEKTRAAIYAQSGVENVLATLNQYTTGSSYWISQPGQLVVGTPSDDTSTTVDERKVLKIAVPLYSGTASITSANTQLQSPNLNVPMWRDPNTHLITDRTDPSDGTQTVAMKVGWIYVTQDGQASKVLRYDATSNPSAAEWIDNPDYNHNSKTNPIVGRYAYWTDDESSKVNYNLAWKRSTTGTSGNTFPSGHPTKVDLTALSGITSDMADAIHGYLVSGTDYSTLKHGFYNTPGDARQVDTVFSGVAASLQTNKFEVTHYNHDPDTTFFNLPRIVLTTQKTRAGGKPFLDIGITDVNKLWNPANIDATAIQSTVSTLVQYLQRTDWPMAPGSSFQQKYYSSYSSDLQKTRLVQLALNIIDYVRCKESPELIVVPTRGTVDLVSGATVFTLATAPSGTNAIIGTTRSPRINEMALIKSGSNFIYKMELYLPPHFGIASLGNINQGFTIGGATKYFNVTNRVANRPTNFAVDTSGTFGPSNDGSLTASTTTWQAGGYLTIEQTIPTVSGSKIFSAATSSTIAITGTVGLRSSFQLGGYKLDIAPLIDPSASPGQALYIMDAGYQNNSTATNTGGSSIEADDPRVNSNKDDWKQNTAHTFGLQNSRYSVGQPAPSAVPQVDTDANGKISAASLYMPPPAGQIVTYPDGFVDDNSAGIVTSVGELGYIHTGMESAAKAGVPWRTLRLQPSNQDSSVVPDWALMDLFTVPVTIPSAASPVFAPYNTSYGGRVNLNSMAVPFNMERILPLAAVLQGAKSGTASTVSANDAANLATAVYNRTLSPTNSITGAYGKLYGYTSGYISPGEIVEIKGIADNGEQSEALVREVANLVTARGEVFSVYTVGQAIKETSDGKLMVQGEQRLQAMVEHKSVPRTDSTGHAVIDPGTSKQIIDIHVTPVFVRNLTP